MKPVTEINVPTLWQSIAIAAAIAIGSFFFIHEYFSGQSLIANIMTAGIYMHDACPEYIAGLDHQPTPPDNCGTDIIPYRWVLAVLVAFVAFCGYMHRNAKPSSPKTGDEKA